MNFDLVDFYHNESRLFGVDTVKRYLTASAELLDALTPGFVAGDYHAAPIAETCGLSKAQEAYLKVAAGAAGRIVPRPQEKEAAMAGYVVSLLMGLVVGVAYGLVQVRSPAPPLIALIGLLGMVLGEQAIDVVKHFLPPPPAASIRQTSGDVRESR